MPQPQGETWLFRVHNSGAERAYLVRYGEEGMSLWTAMQPVAPGVWEAIVQVTPGRYRFGHFTKEGRSYFNGGTYGLTAQRQSAPDPQVHVSALPPLADAPLDMRPGVGPGSGARPHAAPVATAPPA